MFSVLFGVSDRAPRPILRFDLRCLSMLERINVNKLKFIYFLKMSDSKNLAREIFMLQVKHKFIPGLVSEGRELIKKYGLPNIIDDKPLHFTKHKWKSLVLNAIRRKSEEDIKLQFQTYSKLKSDKFQLEEFSLKSYIIDLNLKMARTNFCVRSLTLPLKMNMKSDKKFAAEMWRCDSCYSSGPAPGLSLCPETTSHVLWCPAYASLREGLSLDRDEDVCKYFQAVLRIREETDRAT